MKKLRQLHLYLGCIFAPVLIFFAVSGAWQMFELHRGKKDGSYEPPKIIHALTSVHEVQRLPGANPEEKSPLRYFFLAAAIGLVATTVLGIVMAYRHGRSKTVTIACLLAGVVVPVAILLIY
jgi:hypothetical protein